MGYVTIVSVKLSLVIHPDAIFSMMLPSGAFLRSSGLFFFLGKTNNGGTQSPTALPQTSTVVFLPRLADPIVPTCFLHTFPIIFGGALGTVEIPFSSQLYIRFGGKLCFGIMSW